jgi:hypothetical protein
MEGEFHGMKTMTRALLGGITLTIAIAFAMPARAQVSAAPENGNADSGIASKAISNVAANDTINGAPAALGASGNATVAKSGTWPTGVLLNTTSGAITTTTSTPVGTYGVTYQLCDLSAPPNCNAATDTVNVIMPSIVPVAVQAGLAPGC